MFPLCSFIHNLRDLVFKCCCLLDTKRSLHLERAKVLYIVVVLKGLKKKIKICFIDYISILIYYYHFIYLFIFCCIGFKNRAHLKQKLSMKCVSLSIVSPGSTKHGPLCRPEQSNETVGTLPAVDGPHNGRVLHPGRPRAGQGHGDQSHV